MDQEQNVCTLFKSFFGDDQLRSIRDIQVKEGTDLNDLCFGLSSFTLGHEFCHSKNAVDGKSNRALA